MKKYQHLVHRVLEKAGLEIDGPAPHDPHIHDHRFYERIVSQGSLALGESYMDGWWSCEQLDEFFFRLLRARLEGESKPQWRQALAVAAARIANMQSSRRAVQVANVHYDCSVEFFQAFLDPRMVYSCAYWRNSDTLEQAQEDKLELICRKLRLSSSDRLLDIGCGWGSFLKYAFERYRCESVGVTISRRQADYAERHCAGLPITILASDYRELASKRQGRFNKIVSIGMFEHVGPKNYRTFMRVVDDVLADDGVFLLQTIGDNYSCVRCDPWLDKYIFPNGVAPSVQQVGKAIEGIFVMEDWHNFGADYYRTLMSWHRNLKERYPSLQFEAPMPRDKFYRMWEYFFTSFASAFKARHLQLWQIVMSKGTSTPPYPAIR